MSELKVKYVGTGVPPKLPEYKTSGSVGFDLESDYECDVSPNAITVVGTGLAFEIPDGYELQIRPRSGLAKDYGVTILNSPGTIDADFRGEVKILLISLAGNHVYLKRGTRIAQAVLAKVEKLPIVWAEELSSTDRGSGGFGSTGLT